MKKLSIATFFTFFLVYLHAQINVTPQSQYGRVYTILNTKCQNQSCHSATSTWDNLKFDGDSDAVYQQIFNQPSGMWAQSVANHDLLVNPQMPYNSFLLKKLAGAAFDTDLSLDTLEGAAMGPLALQPLTNVEIEVVRQWIRYGALETYASTDPKYDYGTIYQYYNDSVIIPFYNKPLAPQKGKGYRLRMGPVFLPTSGPFQEQEWLEQQVVNFPYLPEVTEVDGYMNNQSHHFLLFEYPDSASARGNGAPDINNMAQVTPSNLGVLGTTSFDGNKNLTAAWQETADVKLPTGTGLMWGQKTYLDFNFHMKNYNATSVLPCDFYLNVYFEPRNANTIPMISQLINNSTDLGTYVTTPVLCYNIPPKALPYRQEWRQDYADGSNGSGGMRYLWMTAGHTHQYGTGFWIVRADTSGSMADTIYNGQYDYANQAPLARWDHTHPPLEYWNNGLLPVYFGKNQAGTINGGLVANTSWFSDTTCVHFGFTTANEMQLFYYMYTSRLPEPSAVQTIDENPFMLTIQPNPMSGGNGKMVYVLDNTSKVSAEVMDITGKVISKLNDENEVAGAHEISMAGNQKIASGIYFARLTVNGTAYTKKFVVTE